MEWLMGLYDFIPRAGGYGLAFLVLIGVVVALSRGWLVSGSVHRDVIADRDYYREAVATAAKTTAAGTEALSQLSDQLGQLTDSMHTVETVVRALPRSGRR